MRVANEHRREQRAGAWWPGDILLLCTDGLTRHVSDERIAELLSRAPDAASACRDLVAEALAGGGHDNVTVVVARTQG